MTNSPQSAMIFIEIKTLKKTTTNYIKGGKLMKKLFIFAFLMLFTILSTNCVQSTNPVENGLPTIKEIRIKTYEVFLKGHEHPRYISETYRIYDDYEEFFYEYINPIYLDNPEMTPWDAITLMEKNLDKKGRDILNEINQTSTFADGRYTVAIMRTYFNVLSGTVKKHW